MAISGMGNEQKIAPLITFCGCLGRWGFSTNRLIGLSTRKT